MAANSRLFDPRRHHSYPSWHTCSLRIVYNPSDRRHTETPHARNKNMAPGYAFRNEEHRRNIRPISARHR